MDFSSAVPRHARPDRKMFKVGRRVARKAQDFTKLCAYLEEQLRDFKVEGTMTDVTEGPVVTTMEFEPAPGTKTSKIVGLGDDLARLLAARSLRVLAPIPGKKIFVKGRIADKYLRRDKPYLVIEATATDEDGRLLERLKTYQMKKPDEVGKKWHPQS